MTRLTMYRGDTLMVCPTAHWLPNCNNPYNSEHLEDVLQNLKDHNVPEQCWSDYVQNWVESLCLKQDSITVTQGVSRGIEQMLYQYWSVRCEQRYKDILEKIDILILCGILEICFGINETRLVNQVLLCTYESNPLVFNSYFDLKGSSNSEFYNEIKCDRLSYFLWHSSQGRTLYNGQRLTERILLTLAEGENNSPLDVFPLKLEPKILMTILSYGTYDLIATNQDFKQKNLYNFPIFHMLRDILSYMYFLNFNGSNTTQSILERRQESQETVDTLQMILRSIGMIPKGFQENTNFWPDTRWGKYNFSVILQHFVTCDRLPELKQRLCQPVKLQHMCRISIRKKLYKNWQLPDGISKLGLPDSLSRYVELKSD